MGEPRPGAIPPKVLFIFLDGVGVGPPDPQRNPFFAARLPTFHGLMNGEAVSVHLDPLMETDGLPQSGTGQTALLTGVNAAAMYGRHFGPWVPVPLRPVMAERNVLSRAQDAGFSCAFANAYPSQYIHLASTRRPAGPALAAHGARLLHRTEDDLAAGRAVSSEIINTAWRTRLGLTHVPDIRPVDAGRNLAAITETADFTLFAHYATDTAGHERNMDAATSALQRVDAFLSGLLPALPSHTLLILASDHGNIEDVTKGHTRNPVLGILKGPGAERLAAGMESITDVPGVILRHLQESPREPA